MCLVLLLVNVNVYVIVWHAAPHWGLVMCDSDFSRFYHHALVITRVQQIVKKLNIMPTVPHSK